MAAVIKRRSFVVVMLCFAWAVGCASTTSPPAEELVLWVNADSGGDWPVGTSARLFSDGTIQIGDAQPRYRRVPNEDSLLQKVRDRLSSEAFRAELEAAAHPSRHAYSSGLRIRLETGNAVVVINDPERTPEIRKLLMDFNELFSKYFGRHYSRVPLS